MVKPSDTEGARSEGEASGDRPATGPSALGSYLKMRASGLVPPGKALSAQDISAIKVRMDGGGEGNGAGARDPMSAERALPQAAHATPEEPARDAALSSQMLGAVRALYARMPAGASSQDVADALARMTPAEMRQLADDGAALSERLLSGGGNDRDGKE